MQLPRLLPLPLLLEPGESGFRDCACEKKLKPLLSDVPPGLKGVLLSRGKAGLDGSALMQGSSGEGGPSVEGSKKLKNG